MKFSTLTRCSPSAYIHKLLLVMKLTFILLTTIFLQLSFAAHAQKMTFSVKDASLAQLFQEINKQSGYQFLYTEEMLSEATSINLDVKNASINEVLKVSFKHQPLTYNIKNKTIVIQRKVTTPIKELQTMPIAVPVRGVVKDDRGQPLPGVSVKVKGTTTGVVTDIEGRFSFNAPNASATLVFSFVGFTTQEVPINNRQIVNISLVEETKVLNDVVVLGYSSQSKHKIISAVSSVSGEELNKRVETSPSTLLQGQLPGLQVTQDSGEPGAENTQLLVRGVGTFSGAGVNPLIIVDGIPGSIEALNANDIESVTLLKDAAAAAIYGIRGANGVVVIKTKRGKGGDFSIQYNYNVGINKATNLPKLITNSAQYMTLYNLARANSNEAPLYTQAQIDLYANATDRIKYPNHSALGDVFKTAYTQNHYLSMSGGKDNTNYSLGFGATDQPGVFLGNNYKKYTLSVALSSKVSKRITFGTNLQMLYSDKSNPPQGSGDEFLSTLSQSPLYLPQLPNGNYTAKAYSNESSNKNYVAIIKENIMARTQDYYMQGNLSLDVDIIDGLRWENRAGINYDNNKYKSFIPYGIPTYYYNDGSYSGTLNTNSPGLIANRTDNVYYTIYSQFAYNKTLGQHTISAFAGVQQEDNQGSNLRGARLQFPTNYLQELDAGPTTGQTNTGSSFEWATRSLYANLNYDYKDKYFFGSSIRRDGTSRLPTTSRYGTFYSLSGGWRISQENFLKEVKWINDLKIRGSWGELGNQNIGNYPYQPVLSNANYAFGSAVSTGYVANNLVDASLTWETTRITNIGFDLAVLKNSLTITGDYFNKYTYDILRQSQIPYYVGLNSPTINNGAVRNKGVEVAVQYRNKIGNDFSYNIGGNLQQYKNTLVKYGSVDINGTSIRQEGRPLDSYYLYVWDGVYQSATDIANSPKQTLFTATPGDLKLKDANGDGKIDANDRTIIDAKYPKFTYSGNVGARYKQFDISAQVYGSYGRKIFVNGWGIDPFRQGTPPTTDWLNAWTPTNPTNDMPKIYDSNSNYQGVQQNSTYYLKNASYARLKNLQLGYSVPKNLLGKIGVKSLRVFFSGDNLALITKYPGLDPERTSDGFYSIYPQNKVYTFGASIQL